MVNALCTKHLRLVSLELESLRDELQILIDGLDDRLARHEITDYVRNENMAVLRNEVLGLEDCLRGCQDLELSAEETIDELVTRTKQHLRERLSKNGYVPALALLLESRLEKVAAYLKLDTSPT
jgi:hypothetical protein